ncbi:glycosyltransferase [Halomarina ordinaria]|uniref:Glycosyltransferase n=1 Tax=Halomarina ordinaria TaxID=3033939 RepID=A0ABD5UC84_9EURY|nr:glycosyltransferase [Halomarina sp. PSRA2]
MGGHVLWLTPDKPANISVGRRRIAECLEARGFDVTLRGTTPRTLLASVRERDRYDVVVGTTRSGALAGALLRLLGRPLVVDHVDPIRQFEATHPRWLSLPVRVLEACAFRLSTHTLYVYEEEEHRARRHAPAATKADLGVSYERFADPDPAAVERARERLADAGVAPDDRVAVYVGGLEPLYRIEELLAAARYLDGWTLLVLGAGSLEPAVARAARERENVVFLGTVPHEDVPGYLHRAEVGVCLVDDPHTLKVLEYGAAGLSVVQARGRAEARFGEHVTFCDPTPTGVAGGIREAGARRRDADHGPEAFREYVAGFDYDRVAGRYTEVLRTVLGE